jgi:hypothetical protein
MRDCNKPLLIIRLHLHLHLECAAHHVRAAAGHAWARPSPTGRIELFMLTAIPCSSLRCRRG